MKVKFLQDFQGRETSGLFYRKGEVVEFDNEIAEVLIRDNFAVESKESEAVEVVEDAPKAKRGKK